MRKVLYQGTTSVVPQVHVKEVPGWTASDVRLGFSPCGNDRAGHKLDEKFSKQEVSQQWRQST
jgi:hypothetical protein